MRMVHAARLLGGGVALLFGAAYCSIVNAPEDFTADDGTGGTTSTGGSGGQPAGGGGATTTTTTTTAGGSGGQGGSECQDLADCEALTGGCRVAAACLYGECVFEDRPDGTDCEGDLFCTEGDTCTAGACQPGPDPGCVSQDPCESSACDEDADSCNWTTITACVNDDGCCPQNCAVNDDNDCLYWVSGIQENVPASTLAGWTQCHQSTYAATSSLATILANCSGSRLLLACRPVGAQNFTLVAMGDRADVLYDCGNTATCVHLANNVGWYYSTTWSWGFAPPNEPVNRNSCDVESSQGNLRMCWHAGNNNIESGYRCGTNFLNGNSSWERLVFHAN